MADDAWRIRDTGGGVAFSLHVQPRAKTTGIAGLHGSSLKLKISSPAVDGAANRAVVEFLASSLDVPRSAVRILAGEKSREKTIRIDGVRLEQVLRALMPPSAARS
jgi:hypothetical protein